MTTEHPGDARCQSCGFLETDYTSAAARNWMRRALSERARLVFEGMPEESELDGIGTARDLKETLRALATSGELHDAVHLASEAARRSAAHARVEESGSVVQLSSSSGGVPKTAVAEAEVSWRGLRGDRQDDSRHHGHPWQALCLYSSDVILALQREGHPIALGAAGENVTLSGIDWTVLRTGQRLDVGEVVCELTVPATPCEKNAQWFAGGDFLRMSHRRHPGWSRWYAAVVRPGTIRPNDPAVLAPSA